MIGNIYLLEKALEREAVERQALTEQAILTQAVKNLDMTEQTAAPSGARIVLRIGRLALTWATSSSKPTVWS